MLYPNPLDPLNGEAASLLLHHPQKYEEKVRDCVAKANPPPPPPIDLTPESSDKESEESDVDDNAAPLIDL